MKTALSAAAIALLSASALAGPAQAGYVVTLTQQGSDVVATGSGPIDLTGLSLSVGAPLFSEMIPNDGAIVTGPTSNEPILEYFGSAIPVLASFGSGGMSLASSGSGDMVGVVGVSNSILVPQGYVSDSPLSDTSTYAGQTFSSLGVTPGVYEWAWGSGANQNFTLDIGAAVPEPSTWAMMALGFAGLGFLGYRKTRGDNALA
jgi:hypothetical protein